MKKSLFIVVVLSVFLISCSTNSTTNSSQKAVADTTEVVAEKQLKESSEEIIAKDSTAQESVVQESIPQDVEQFDKLYKELLGFKSKNDFKQYGFGQGGPYYAWMKRAEAFCATADNSHFISYGFLPGDLISLASVYVGTKGAENEASKCLRTAIDKGLAKAMNVK